METLRSKLWVWGHPAHSLPIRDYDGSLLDSGVTPIEGMRELGAQNLFYVPMGITVDREACNREMTDAVKTGWSMESEANVLTLIEQKQRWPNLSIGIFDDFFREENEGWNYKVFPPENLIALRRKMHDAGLEMWVVFYTRDIGQALPWDYLKLFDGVTLWFWHEPEKEEFDRQCRWFFEHTEGQKRMIGCYLYNFGDGMPATPNAVRYQLDQNRSFLQNGLLQGVILHTNAAGGLGLAAYEEAKRWVAEHGDELLP